MHSRDNSYLLDTVDDNVEPKPLVEVLAASWFSLAWLQKEKSTIEPEYCCSPDFIFLFCRMLYNMADRQS